MFQIPLLLIPTSHRRPVLVGDGVSMAQERRDDCCLREVILDDERRNARTNVALIEMLRKLDTYA